MFPSLHHPQLHVPLVHTWNSKKKTKKTQLPVSTRYPPTTESLLPKGRPAMFISICLEVCQAPVAVDMFRRFKAQMTW